MMSPLFSILNGSFLTSLFNVFTFNLTVLKTPNFTFNTFGINQINNPQQEDRSFSSKDAELANYYDQFLFIENASSQRATRFSNALVNYDYKTGHYLGEWDKLYPQLTLSFIEVARGIRKPS